MNAPFDKPEEDQDLLRARILGTESEIHLKTWYPSLKGALAELKDLNARLEGRVAAATEELRRANEDLEERNRDLEESRERLLKAEALAAYGRLAGQVAHELNTPLGALLSATSALPGEAEAASGAAFELGHLDHEEGSLVRALLARGLETARVEPLAMAGRQDRSRLEAAILALGGGHPDPRLLAEDLLSLGITCPEDPLLAAVAAQPRLLDLALKLSAPARSAAIARDAARQAAASIAELRGLAEGRAGPEAWD